MDKPDKIWAGPGAYPTFSEDDWTNASASANVEFGSAYLLSTPERELASELVEALRVYSDPCDADDHGTCPYDGNMCCRAARAVLAKLEGKG